MQSSEYIKVGRGHDSQVRVTDISVSRFHALFRKSFMGDFVVEDNSSKFGTLILVRRPMQLASHQTNYFQLGRTLLEVNVKVPSNCCDIRSLCFMSKVKSSTKNKNSLIFDGTHHFPEEFLPKPVVEFTMEEEALTLTKQVSARVKILQSDRLKRDTERRSLSLRAGENPPQGQQR